MNKKGFTLIELLAVILVLGIIALIAIPTVTKVIDQAKKGAFEATVKNIVKVVEDECQKDMLLGNATAKTYTFTDGVATPTINVKGKLPTEGTIEVDNSCKTTVNVTDGKYVVNNLPEPTDTSCFEYEEENGEITITGYLCGNHLSYTYNDKIEVISDDSGTILDVVIPSTINNKPVTQIATGAFSQLIFSNGFDIENDEFQMNESNKVGISTIIIPDSVTTIGEGAFAYNQLTSITIPSKITSIGAGAFGGNKLTSIKIPNSVISIGEGAFFNNQLTSVTIPNSVITIGEYAFALNQLTSVTIGTGVTSIGNYAFRTNKLTSVTVPNSVISIGNGAFCNNPLKDITIPESVTNIGECAFTDNCFILG